MPSATSENNGPLRASVQELLVEVAVLKSRLNDSKDALNVQAKEYERRLSELNHAHTLAEKRDIQFVSRDLHDRLHITVGNLENRITAIESKNSVMYAVAAMVVALVSLAVTAWRSFRAGM